ncbi:hypothetical protein [Burkholderia pseudomallei]|nr:hypothetical protein [Burkholderia pseudomallei]
MMTYFSLPSFPTLMDAVADELDNEQWAELVRVDGIRQTGIEPPNAD